MENLFIEENGAYSIDCKAAVWATDKIHEDYHNAGIHINDVDFLIENSTHILMVEYKIAKQIENGTAFFPSGEYWKWEKIDRPGRCSFHR